MSYKRENITTEYFVTRISDNKILTIFGFKIGFNPNSVSDKLTVALPFPSDNVHICKIPVPSSSCNFFSSLEKLEPKVNDGYHFLWSIGSNLTRLFTKVPKELILPNLVSFYPNLDSVDWKIHKSGMSPEREKMIKRVYNNEHALFFCEIPSTSQTQNEIIRTHPVAFITTGNIFGKCFVPCMQYPESQLYLEDWNTIVYSSHDEIKGHNKDKISCTSVQYELPNKLKSGWPWNLTNSIPSNINKFGIFGYHPNCDLIIHGTQT